MNLAIQMELSETEDVHHIKASIPMLSLVETINKEYQDIDLLKSVIENETRKNVLDFVLKNVDLTKGRTILLTSSIDHPYVSLPSKETRTIIDLNPINDINKLNSHFRVVNSALPKDGIYIGCVETYHERKVRLRKKYNPVFFNALWGFDFIINRVMPKLFLTSPIYSIASGGVYNVMSTAEVLGRLSYAGFEINGYQTINNLLYFSVTKSKETRDDENPSYGLYFKMNRVCKNGEIKGIFKVRTMHPYSEYLQKYVVSLGGYNETGKPNNDFRLTSWGKVIRKLHIDELPQLLNVLKGDLAIVGVRPISRFGFAALPADLQQERIKYKPGCIPPNVALCLTGFDGVIEAERKYLSEMKKNPYFTNFKYFWKAIYNLSVRKIKSA